MSFRKLIFFAVLIFVLNCSKTSGSKISDEFIEKLSVTNDSFPSALVGYNLYAITDSDLVFVTNVNSLYEIYNNHYQAKFKNYHSFLTALLKSDFKISKKAVQNNNYGTFILDKKITSPPLESIVTKYFDKSENSKKYYFYPKDLSYDTKQTILYRMFLDGYLISFDDYGGKFTIEYDTLKK